MSTPALSTRGLDKSFGSLVVAKRHRARAAAGRALRADRAERRRQDHADQPDDRHAAAGRRPDLARRARTSPRSSPRTRVRRGLVRTFQINTLFPHLNALEAVTLAVCERRGVRRHLVAAAAGLCATRSTRPTPSSRRCGSAASCYRPTHELAYGQQRLLEIALALATKPKVLLLDEPAAGVPQRARARSCSPSSPACRKDITVLFIEHDMNVVFRFASRIIVMVGGRILVEGTPEEIAADRACARSISAGRTMAEPLLALDDVRAGYGDAVVLDGISFEVAERGSLARARAQRRRQVARCCSPSWASPRCAAAPSSGAAATSRGWRRTAAPAPASAGWRRSARFSRRSRVEENLTVASRPGRWDLAAVYELFPAAQRAPRQPGQPALRRRAADAGDRARADDQSGAAAARRAARGAGADHRRGADRARSGA